MNSKISLLHSQALAYAKTYLNAESGLIRVLQEIESCRGYRELGFKSLFEYAVSALGLSESVTYNLITVARKSLEVPMLQKKIEAGEITLSNARKIAPVLTIETQEKWLHAASTLSKRELEKEIVKENPQLAIQERAKPIAPERLELRVGISEKLHQELIRAQEIVSSQTKKPATLEETLEALAELFLKREDPIEKAKRAREARKAADPERREIPASLRHQVKARDEDRCTYIQNGKRCMERKWLDIHHICPVSEGGLTSLENLTTLCRGHHQLSHLCRDRLGSPDVVKAAPNTESF